MTDEFRTRFDSDEAFIAFRDAFRVVFYRLVAQRVRNLCLSDVLVQGDNVTLCAKLHLGAGATRLIATRYAIDYMAGFDQIATNDVLNAADYFVFCAGADAATGRQEYASLAEQRRIRDDLAGATALAQQEALREADPKADNVGTFSKQMIPLAKRLFGKVS